MTNEEAIKMLQTEKACVERQERKQNCNRYCESCDLCMPIEDVIEGYNCAIRALKNEQTDGDLISREKVEQYLATLLSDYLYDEERMRLEKFEEWLCELPSYSAKEDTAEWIYRGKFTVCSNCGEKIPYGIHNYYCRNCGAEMKGETE